MKLLLTEIPNQNKYIESLILAYQKKEIEVICGAPNFFFSNMRVDFIHIHWPETLYLWSSYLSKDRDKIFNKILNRFLWYKKQGVIIIHTLHNLLPHDSQSQSFDKKIFNLFIDQSDILVHHCERSVDLIKKAYPSAKYKKNIVAGHPDYLLEYKFYDKHLIRKELGIPLDAFVILNFGNLKRYKSESLIEKTFKILKMKNKYLLTAGKYDYNNLNYSNRILTKIRNKLRTNFKPSDRLYIYRMIDDEEIAKIFNLVDLVFVSHQGLTSGVLAMAATFAKPVVFPLHGCFGEQMKNWHFKSFEFGNSQSAAQSILDMKFDIENGIIELDNSLWKKKNSWDNYVAKIVESIKLIK